MKKLTLFAVIAAMLLGIVGLTAYAEADTAAASVWGYDVPCDSEDFSLSINQSGDIIVAEMKLLNQEADCSLYATLSYKKPDGALETSNIKLINAYRSNPTPCVYFYIDHRYSEYCDMFVTFIDRSTLKPYVESVNVNEHFNIEQRRYEVNGIVNSINPIEKTMEFVPHQTVVDKDGNTLMDSESGRAYTLSCEYVDAEAYLMRNAYIIFAANSSDYTLLNITGGSGGSLVTHAEKLAEGGATVSSGAATVEYRQNYGDSSTAKIDTIGNIPVIVNGYNISGEIDYPIDLYTLFEGTDAKIEFVENTGDRYYDAIVATVYEHGIVEEISLNDGKICFRDGNHVIFNSENSSQSVKLVDENGKKLELSEIKPDDVLAMSVGLSSVSITNGHISVPSARRFGTVSNAITVTDLGNKTVSGTIGDSDGKNTVIIGGSTYRLGNFAGDDYNNLYGDDGKAKIDSVGVFYLDINNKIIDFVGRGGGEYYGYILQMAYFNDAFDKRWEVRILTEDGNQVYSLAKAVNFDGDIYKNMDGSEDAFNRYGKDNVNYFKNNPTANIIKYKLKDGRISSISTLNDSEEIGNDSEYKPSAGKIGSRILAEKAVVFNISGDKSAAAATESIDYLKADMLYCGYVAEKRDSEWRVLVVTEAKEAEPSGDESGDSVMKIVTATKSITYGDDDAFEVTYIDNGTADTDSLIFIADSKDNANTSYLDLKPGDIFIANADENRVVKDYTVLAEMATDCGVKVIPGAFEKAFGDSFSGKNGLENGVDYICGYINGINKRGDDTVPDIVYGSSGEEYNVSINADVNQYFYTRGRNVQITAGEWEGDTIDIPDNGKCSPVFVKLCDGAVTDIYTLNTRVDTSNVTLGSSAQA